MPKCTQCDFEAKSVAGLSTHTRKKHEPTTTPPEENKTLTGQNTEPNIITHPVNEVNAVCWQLHKQILDGDQRAHILSHLDSDKSVIDVLYSILGGIKDGEDKTKVQNLIAQYAQENEGDTIHG